MTRVFVAALLLVPALTTCGATSSGEANFRNDTRGLEQQHLASRPFYERVNCPPAVPGGDPTTCETSRIYDDGTLYFWAENRWARLTTVRRAGLNRLRQILNAGCDVDPNAQLPEGHGSSTHRFHVQRCAREVRLPGSAYGPYEGFRGITTIINSNLTPLLPETE